MENKVRIILSTYHPGILFQLHYLACAGIPYFFNSVTWWFSSHPLTVIKKVKFRCQKNVTLLHPYNSARTG